ncbi:60S ribosomal protein L13-1-like protein [Tanacetum coccineum]
MPSKGSVFPRPAGRLRPQVHGQTLKYNMKIHEGRGFSLEELKASALGRFASLLRFASSLFSLLTTLVEGILRNMSTTFKHLATNPVARLDEANDPEEDIDIEKEEDVG